MSEGTPVVCDAISVFPSALIDHVTFSSVSIGSVVEVVLSFEYKLLITWNPIIGLLTLLPVLFGDLTFRTVFIGCNFGCCVPAVMLIICESVVVVVGVVGVVVIVVVVLFCKFNCKVEEFYALWDSSENDDVIVVNPLYQEFGSKGENPFFEARQEL